MTIPTLSSHNLLVLWVQLATLLAAARLLGSGARRLGQPAVVGELVAGLVLGPSVFGHVWRSGFRWLLPHGPSSAPLLGISALSLVFLLVVIGAETDLRLIARLGRAAASVSLASIVVPLAAGGALALVLPAILVGHHGRATFALLMAAAVAVSSLPVIARIVIDMGHVRRDVGQLAIAAATVNDTTGFLVLALASGLVANGGLHVAVALVGLLGIGAVALTGGQAVLDRLFREARRREVDAAANLAIGIVASLAAAAAMEAVGVEGALGAFVVGMALGRSRFLPQRTLDNFATVTAAFFSPLYFATAGLRVDVGSLGLPGVAVAFVAVTVVAAISKFVGAIAGGRAARLHWRESAALGVVLNGRGALQVIIATGGLTIGILDTASYSVIVLMAIVTSLVVPPVLHRIVRDWGGTPEEQERLQREKELGRNVIVRGQRLLLPSRGSPNSVAVATVLAAAWPEESEVTVLSVAAEGEASADIEPIVEALAPRTAERRHVGSEEVLEEILTEARLGYGVIALGAAEEPGPHHLLSAVLDDLLVESPIPLVVVRRARGALAQQPPLSKVVVPVSGTPAARAGQEVAYNLSRTRDSTVVLVHVVTRSDPVAEEARRIATPSSPLDGRRRRGLAEPEGAAQVVLGGARSMADEMGIEPEMLVRHGSSPGDEIVAVVKQTGADTIALGSTVRQVDGHPFLGHTVEQVLAESDATVILVLLPEVSSRLGALVAETATAT
ncbi:MAG TPA: hypothetical protein DCQ30_01245 [Acidimicrobiaceae bacterium]|nr:hypothetical protein [Acidimicrobiaceae bacterium]